MSVCNLKGGGSTRLTVERDGKPEVVEVAPDLASVEVDGRSFPVTVVSTSPTRVELEVGGERVVVDNWPEHFAQPPGPVDVSGERWKVTVTPVAGRPGSTPPGTAGRTAAPLPLAPVPSGHSGEGTAVPPPMPGRVIEVRVKEGDPVRKGDVLLVLEAMKMRNEIVSPVEGVVRGLRVAAGSNARAKEPMLYVVPMPGG